MHIFKSKHQLYRFGGKNTAMKRNMAHMFLPHAFIALVDSVCIFNMLPVCCAAIIFKSFQNMAFSPS